MALPRFLPLVAVAVAGVFALKAITSLEVMPDVFKAATAFAADAQKSDKKTDKPAAKKAALKAAGKGEVDKSDDPTQSYGIDPALMAADAASQGKDAAATAPMTPICATSVNDLAKQAGISPNELNILQSLGQRRAQLDQREQQLNSRAQLIEAADSKLDARITQLSGLKTQIQGLLDQATKVQDDDTTRLVAVYAAMKPKDAAAAMTIMSDDVRLPIAAKMKDRALAAILGAMTADAAKDLTEKLAKRMQRADGLQQQLNKTAAGGPAAPGAVPSKPAVPAKKG
jgi:flagellar motility protein MotE (MotC chaperone)